MAKKSPRSRRSASVFDASGLSAEGEPTAAAESPEGASTASMSKVDAVRACLARGVTSPKQGVAYIQEQYGLTMNPQHFSAVKSLLAKKGDAPASRRGRPKADATGRSATPGLPADGSADLLDAIETMKPLIAALGAEKVKRIVDLLG